MTNFFSPRWLSILGVTVTSLGVGSLTPLPAKAQTNSGALNPCPQIYYEEPFNRRFLSPEGCPANLARQTEMTNGVTQPSLLPATPLPSTTLPSPSSSGLGVIQPPLPEDQGVAIATIQPTNQQVAVRLINQTNASVTYEVIGDTNRRTLMGGETVSLTGLPLPSTITAVRADGGLLDFKAMNQGEGQLDVMLSADPTFDDIQGVLRIQADGQVFIN